MRLQQVIQSGKRATWPLLALGLINGLSTPLAHAQNVPETAEAWAQVVAQLPEPKDKPASWPRSCLQTMKEFSDARKLTFTSPAVAAKYRANLTLSRVIGNWGVQRLQMPSGPNTMLCADYPYVLSKLQEAAGDEPTGVLGERDIERLETAIRLGVEKGAQAIAEREKHLLSVFGIPLGAPLRMAECPMPMGRVVQRPKFVPATCKQKLGRSDEHVPTVTVYFSEADSPSWLGSIGQSNSLDLPNPSLRLDISNWLVTGIHFESNYQADAIAVEALTKKFGVKPTVTKPTGSTCLNFVTGDIGPCSADFHHITWNVKDFIVRGECNYRVFRCKYVIQMASAVAAKENQQQKERAEQKERALRSGRPL